MTGSDDLIERVRASLAHLPDVVEKKMFRGITFMVNGKMCIGVGRDELMCRIDPVEFDDSIERIGCRPMIHGKRMIKGFVFVAEEGYNRKKDFDFWIGLALDFNKTAKSSRKK